MIHNNWVEQVKAYEALREEVQSRLATCPIEERRAWSNLGTIINEKLSHVYAENQDHS